MQKKSIYAKSDIPHLEKSFNNLNEEIIDLD
jgi:hypothetical protein